MSEFVKITGTNAFGKPLEKYYKGSAPEAEKSFLLAPADSGGAVSWATETVEELPDHVYITCPHCSKKLENPNLVTDL